ncbi:MAG: hypothetical protein JSU03_00880 [Bacteroidetes bacterium]|nr:hypothetical protein [Bacteroidota bacterium]
MPYNFFCTQAFYHGSAAYLLFTASTAQAPAQILTGLSVAIRRKPPALYLFATLIPAIILLIPTFHRL